MGADVRPLGSKQRTVRVSFVIPAFNEEKYIGPLLRELASLRDHGAPIEIIVVDGFSEDRTASTAALYSDLVISRARSTIAAARNAGASVARGDILFHTDADVRLSAPATSLESVYRAFDDPGTAAATARLRVYPSEELFSDRLAHLLFHALFQIGRLFGDRLAKGECQIVRTSTFKEVGGFPETIALGEDCLLWSRLSQQGRIRHLRQFEVYHSPRRFRETGYLRTILTYVREAAWLLVARRPYTRYWKPVR
jgi:glycosyltransferase involved in cell wall biosynthesis